jgi:pimeloyl-ACP methyl ester carboxylesterase
MYFCIYLVLFLVGALMANDTQSMAAQTPDVEAAVCGSFREPFMFWLWHLLAGSPSQQRLAHIKNVERLRFRTRDGIELGGYKLTAQNATGSLLVAQGNAMLADHLVADLQFFRDLGVDVYLFDYRGYGLSQGKSRLAAIVADYEEVVADLNNQEYAQHLLYGISMGGVILLNAVGHRQTYTRLVVDSSPSRISDLGCPERYDPVRHLPEDSSRLMIISGERDRVVTPRQMGDLLTVARTRGARVLQDPEFAHPYQDASAETHRRRLGEVATFLLPGPEHSSSAVHHER